MFIELAHMVGGYTTACSLHLHTWSVLRKSWDGVGLGWCGVGMVMFIELAHMVGATQQHVPCTCTHGRCYASHGMGWGWGGVGWAWLCSLNLHTWSVLHNSMFLALAHMVGATQVMGWGGVGVVWGGHGYVH